MKNHGPKRQWNVQHRASTCLYHKTSPIGCMQRLLSSGDSNINLWFTALQVAIFSRSMQSYYWQHAYIAIFSRYKYNPINSIHKLLSSVDQYISHWQHTCIHLLSSVDNNNKSPTDSMDILLMISHRHKKGYPNILTREVVPWPMQSPPPPMLTEAINICFCCICQIQFQNAQQKQQRNPRQNTDRDWSHGLSHIAPPNLF